MQARSPEAKVLYIALDACDAGVVRELVAAGSCPNIAGLMRRGAVVDTIAPYGTFVGSSWMTISTGTEVSNHRYWNWLEIDPQTYDLRSTTPRDSRRPPFWQHLSDSGNRVAVFDVPHADIPADLDGILIKEWGCHDRHFGTAAHPAEVLNWLESNVGGHPYGSMTHPRGDIAFAPCDYTLRAGQYRTLEEERQFQDLMLEGIARKEAASSWLLGRGPWDLFMTVFGEGHCVGHQFWHVHDTRHPRYTAAARHVLGDPLVAVYERLDAAVGNLADQVTAETTVWLQFNHGMGPHYDGEHLLDEVLRRIDADSAGVGWRSRSMQSILPRLPRRALEPVVRAAAASARRRQPDAPTVNLRTGPNPTRRFYEIPGNTAVGAIRLNVVGREREGKIARGADFDEVCAEIESALLQLVNIDTGRPAVSSVVRADEVFERSDDDRLPDVFVEWDRSAPIERVWSPAIGTVAARYDNWRSGDHNDRGLVVVAGPGIEPGRREQPMALVDVTATLCAALGAPLPGTDGRVHSDLIGRTGAQQWRAIPVRRQLRPLGSPTTKDDTRRRPSDDRLGGAALDLTGELARRVDRLERRLAGREAALEERVASLERESLVWATMAWLAQEEVAPAQLVTVVTPTHQRPEKLRRAIASVLAQRYGNWELVIVDDGGTDAESVAAEFDDPRIVVRSVPHGGPCAARNEGLRVATGAIVTYLDDDNSMDPGWLHAVSWAFANHPDHTVLYGARLIDDRDRVLEIGSGGWPWLHFRPFDRSGLRLNNFVDMGAIAHRAGIPGAVFDETLVECGDWDLFINITQDRDPLELPAIALSYRTDGNDRLTGVSVEDRDRVRTKWSTAM